MKNYPKFLNEPVAATVVDMVYEFVINKFPLKRLDMHIVVIVPCEIVDESLGAMYPSKYKIEPHLLYEKSFGGNWKHNYSEIAKCKALQLWNGFNPGGKVLETPAHLLFSNYTPFWGGDIMEGIVVACSGVQPHFDKMISRMVLSALIGIAKENWETSGEKAQGVDFLS